MENRNNLQLRHSESVGTTHVHANWKAAKARVIARVSVLESYVLARFNSRID